MKEHFLISLATDMVRFVGDLLLEHEPVSKSLVVFPGKRPGYFIRKYLAENLHTVFIPPSLLSIDAFIEHINDELGHSRRVVDAIDSLPLIYNLNKKSRVIGANQPELSLDEFLFWGQKLFSDFEELHIEEIAPETIRSVDTLITEKLPTGIRQKLNSLSDLYTAFYEHIEKNDLTTRAHQYCQAAAYIDRAMFNNFDRIYICGFFALTASEKRIFRHLSKDKRVHFVFQDGPGIDRVLQDMGINPAKHGADAQPPRLHFHKAMDSHAEIFGLNRVIQKEKDLDFRDVIVIPEPDALFPIVHSTLGFVKEYNISMGYPIYRTPLNTLITALERLIENKQGNDYLTADYMRLVLHPYVKNIYLNKASYPTRIIFHTIEEYFVKYQQRFICLADLEKNKAVLNDCVQRLSGFQEKAIDRTQVSKHLKMIHDLLIRSFSDIKSVADCAEKIIRIISFISQNSPANEHPFTGSFIKAMIEGLYALQVSDLGTAKLSSQERYFRLILTYLKSINHPFIGTPVKGLQVLGFLETRNIKFDRVFFLDANEGVLPHTVKEDTTLPHAVRKVMHLPTVEDWERISRYYFSNLVAGSAQTDIFFIESEDKEKSRFVERLIWDIQKKEGKLDYPSSEVFFPVYFDQSDPEAIPKTTLFREIVKKGISFSATSLNNYLECPLLYYYRKILGLESKQGVAEDPDAMGVGGIVHDILMHFFIPKIGKPLRISKTDYATMEKHIDAIFKKRYPDADRGSVYLIKSQVKRRLVEFLRYQEQNPEFQNTVIRECESVSSPGQKPDVFRLISTKLMVSNKREVGLSGKIDRVDERNGMYYIIDYKTGKIDDIPNHKKFDPAQREEWPKTLKSVQLPLYIMMYLENHKNVKINTIDAGLLGLGGRGFEFKPLFSGRVPDDERPAIFDAYRQAIITLIEEILDLDRPFIMTRDKKNCEGCDYAVICGRQWVAKRW